MKKFSLFLCLFLVLTGCYPFSSKPPAKTSRTEFVFGTVVTITVYGDEKTAESAIAAVFSRLDEIEKVCSYTLTGSELSRLNESAYAAPFEASPELYALVEKSLALCERTNGAFDITLGELIDLWIPKDSEPTVPSDADIKALLPYLGYENVVLDGRKIGFKNEYIKLHLGGIAKGYAADEITEVFAENGVTGAVADLGGDLLLFGKSPRKDGAWNVGITDPFDKSRIIDTYTTDGGFVMTSGNYERYFEQDGVRYHHIFDRNTGYPANSGLASATIGGSISGLACDAYATAVFATGKTDFFPQAGEVFDYVVIYEKGGMRGGYLGGGVCVFDGVDSA